MFSIGYVGIAYCQNQQCGEEFEPTESSSDEFCSWECYETAEYKE